jgi:hypothetical protein
VEPVSKQGFLKAALKGKNEHRRELARLPIEQKVAIVEQLREMVYAAGRAPAIYCTLKNRPLKP